MKTFLILIALLFATAIAEDVFQAEDIVSSIEEDESLVEGASEFLEVKSKLSAEARLQHRADLVNLWSESNLDFDVIESQELIEEKSGKGYSEMGPIMKKVDELEAKIKAKIISEEAKYNGNMVICRNNLNQITRNISSLGRRVQKHTANVKNQSARFDDSERAKAVCAGRIAKYSKQLSTVKDLKEVDLDGYKKRRAKRMNELLTLRKALALVCTFEEFLQSETCKTEVVGRKLNDIEAGETETNTATSVSDMNEAATEAIKKYEEEHAKRAAAMAKEIEAGTFKVPKVAVVVKATDTVESLMNMSTEDLKAHRAAKVVELENLLGENSDDIAKPVRLLLVYAKGGAKMLKENPDDLPPLLWGLFTRISDEMKRESEDIVKMLKDYDSRMDALAASVSDEVDKQKAENEAQIGFNRSINNSQAAVTIAQRELGVQSNAKLAEQKRCYNVTIIYRQEAEKRKGKLRNMDELRSLLRVLQNSDLPKCPNDCTAVTQGKCIWKGMMGKDSFCRCKSEFYGTACELKKCPGNTGLLQHDQRGVCNNRGTCDNKTGQCACRLPYFHGGKAACELKHCPDNVDKCGGPARGKCNTGNGVCECTTKHYGSVCQYTKCLGSSNALWRASDSSNACNGAHRGACNANDGTCRCGGYAYGRACEYLKCPYNCYGRGSCNASNGTCACNSAYKGAYCQHLACPDNCSGAGTCVRGRCSCQSGRVGHNCRLPGWCSTGTPWVSAFYGRGGMFWKICPPGTMIVGLLKSWGTSLYSITHMHCRKPCDNNSSSYGRYTTHGSSYCVVVNWWASFDYDGWSTCPTNFFLTGLKKNSCHSLFCIEEAYCCRIAGATYNPHCPRYYVKRPYYGGMQWQTGRRTSWRDLGRNSPAAVHVPNGQFITGFRRMGDIRNGWLNQGLPQFDMAGHCDYKH